MPLDAICLSAVVRETAAQVENTRIEKIQQPARDQVVLLLRGGRRLLLCAGATQPRLHLTALLRDNPSQPPMFCMLLRKHLAGGRIVSVEQEPLERVVTLHIQAADELGEQRPWRLILEAMPRHANLILVDHQGRITDCLRRGDFEMSQQRQGLPGLFYHLPPRQEKRSPLEVSREEFLKLLSALPEGAPLDGWLLDTFTALPPLLARELEQLQTAALYGYCFDGFSGGDAQWCPLSQALGELNDPAIFALLTEEDCGTIADFLENHSYRNDPELTESDVAPILDRVEAVLAEYHSAG